MPELGKRRCGELLYAVFDVLADHHVGAFVTLGGFTGDAEEEARIEARAGSP
jgi:hypothetical protein